LLFGPVSLSRRTTLELIILKGTHAQQQLRFSALACLIKRIHHLTATSG
jgi:hypothetical protein